MLAAGNNLIVGSALAGGGGTVVLTTAQSGFNGTITINGISTGTQSVLSISDAAQLGSPTLLTFTGGVLQYTGSMQ